MTNTMLDELNSFANKELEEMNDICGEMLKLFESKKCTHIISFIDKYRTNKSIKDVVTLLSENIKKADDSKKLKQIKQCFISNTYKYQHNFEYEPAKNDDEDIMVEKLLKNKSEEMVKMADMITYFSREQYCNSARYDEYEYSHFDCVFNKINISLEYKSTSGDHGFDEYTVEFNFGNMAIFDIHRGRVTKLDKKKLKKFTEKLNLKYVTGIDLVIYFFDILAPRFQFGMCGIDNNVKDIIEGYKEKQDEKS